MSVQGDIEMLRAIVNRGDYDESLWEWAKQRLVQLEQIEMFREMLGIPNDAVVTIDLDESVTAVTDIGAMDWFKFRYVIWSIEHQAWWRWNSLGYTAHLHEAGLYHETESYQIVDRAKGQEVRIAVRHLLGPQRGPLPEDGNDVG